MTADGYSERLRCPASWYLTGALGGLVIAPEISFVTPLPFWSTALFGVVFSTVVVAWISRARIEVVEGVLHVAGARLPVRYVEAVIPLDPTTMRRLLGRDGDPAAFLATKPWVGAGVQIVLDDPEDPAPYWAVSTRHPRELAAALRQARDARQPPVDQEPVDRQPVDQDSVHPAEPDPHATDPTKGSHERT